MVPTVFFAVITAYMAGLRTDFYHLSMYWLTLTGERREGGRDGGKEGEVVVSKAPACPLALSLCRCTGSQALARRVFLDTQW